ncbi:serine/threonine protein kinase [Paenibacillus tianmuensis]|uniref:Serine/threonine protein kinase n=1 Tax=Paenibacillus tianmuensis TaxID=624147 RepID=A0A1G4TIZ4_9BACL|nr:serine/threonine-protein kinase [Paenibacillus tianmuensis]SCW81306.1 serine/threonine protein kinase [Paenibacillus tianmuensis]
MSANERRGNEAMLHYGLQPGQTLTGRYRIMAPLGSGGMSRVFLAEDLKLKGKKWAVKETYIGDDPSAGESGQEAALRRHMLLKEAETMSRLSHPNLPDIVDYVPANAHGFLYLVMDYIEGETLLQRFERLGRRMSEGQAAEIAQQLCGLLDYLHSLRPEPIIHRDLKPSNLMLDADGRVRLIDFGTARSFKAEQAADTVLLGTVGFAAPEQFDGRQSDPHTDLYGLGALLYFLLSGGAYYNPQSPYREAEAAIPYGIAPIVLRLLRASPDGRFADAREAGAALAGWLAAQQPQRLAAQAGAQPQPGAAWTPPLVVAVGALYPGAGATFAALALARQLHDLGVPHAVIEPPAPQAELSALLFADKNAPSAYRCYNAAGQGGRPDERPWADGHTLWLPAEEPAPGAEEAQLDAGGWLKLFHAVRRPVCIVDVGAQWDHPAVRELLETATDVVYAVDPFAHKLELPATRRRLRELEAWLAPGRRLHCFAVKALKSPQTEAWLRLLPQRPACLLPAVDLAALTEAGWQGRLPHDTPPVRDALREAMLPWLRRWLPDEVIPAQRERNRLGPATKLLRLFQFNK